jgi:hypothetical protein
LRFLEFTFERKLPLVFLVFLVFIANLEAKFIYPEAELLLIAFWQAKEAIKKPQIGLVE